VLAQLGICEETRYAGDVDLANLDFEIILTTARVGNVSETVRITETDLPVATACELNVTEHQFLRVREAITFGHEVELVAYRVVAGFRVCLRVCVVCVVDAGGLKGACGLVGDEECAVQCLVHDDAIAHIGILIRIADGESVFLVDAESMVIMAVDVTVTLQIRVSATGWAGAGVAAKVGQ